MSISSCYFIELSNALGFPDPEPPNIKIMWGWFGIYDHFLLCSLLFSFLILSKLNILDNRSSSLNYFKEIPFYNTYIEEPKFEPLKNIDLYSELPFYEELNVIITDHVFKGYVMP